MVTAENIFDAAEAATEVVDETARRRNGKVPKFEDLLKAGPKSFTEFVRGKTKMSRVFWTRGLAEIGSILGATVGAAVVGDVVLKAPYSGLKARLSKAYVEPNLEEWDKYLGELKSIDPEEGRLKRQQLPREEQALKIVDLLMDTFVLKGAAGIVGQYYAQEALGKAFNIAGRNGQAFTPKVNAMSIAADKVTVGAAMFVMNRVTPEQSIQAQNTLEKVFRGVGMEEERAESLANYVINLQVPNLLGMAASMAALYMGVRRR